MAPELPFMEFTSPAAFRAWLEEHHTQPDGIRLKIAKKGSGVESITYSEAVDEALCYGWIDGQKESFDETWFVQRFTPRRARSRWSKVNRDRVERLVAEGRMRPAGSAQVEAAKSDGRWDAAYDSSRTATMPEDLQAALDADPAAKAFFQTLNSTNRFAILYRVHDAKRPETRAKRIAQFVDQCREGRTLH